MTFIKANIWDHEHDQMCIGSRFLSCIVELNANATIRMIQLHMSFSKLSIQIIWHTSRSSGASLSTKIMIIMFSHLEMISFWMQYWFTMMQSHWHVYSKVWIRIWTKYIELNRWTWLALVSTNIATEMQCLVPLIHCIAL